MGHMELPRRYTGSNAESLRGGVWAEDYSGGGNVKMENGEWGEESRRRVVENALLRRRKGTVKN